MGHIVLRHTVERMVQDAAVSLLLRRAPGRQAAGAILRKVGHQMLTRAFSRENEFKADCFAKDLVTAAGGDPLGGVQLLSRLDHRSAGRPSDFLGEYFSTHPPLSERIARLGVSRCK
jgi:Zn-dependent protease with chaperone function